MFCPECRMEMKCVIKTQAEMDLKGQFNIDPPVWLCLSCKKVFRIEVEEEEARIIQAIVSRDYGVGSR